jgi:hypothetical protein
MIELCQACTVHANNAAQQGTQHTCTQQHESDKMLLLFDNVQRLLCQGVKYATTVCTCNEMPALASADCRLLNPVVLCHQADILLLHFQATLLILNRVAAMHANTRMLLCFRVAAGTISCCSCNNTQTLKALASSFYSCVSALLAAWHDLQRAPP